MGSCGIVLITVESELIHTSHSLDCQFELPEIQFALSTKVAVIFVLLFVFFPLYINQISD